MKATEAKLLEFIRNAPQFEIPIYQRTYSWTEAECLQLWRDILRVGRDDGQAVHFVGSVVYIESGLYQVSTSDPVLVIDGQQRLTTVTLILMELERALREWSVEEPFDGFSPAKLRNRYLVNPDEDGDRHQKLVLTQTDRTTLGAALSGAEYPQHASVRVVQNLELFRGLFEEHRDDLEALCRGLAKLVIVDVSLTRGQDNPQLIFESMNSTGKELSQADLIRNFVLMGLEPKLQTHLYEKYWRPMELDFGQEKYQSDFDLYMRHYLTTKTGEIPRIGDVYEKFKLYANSPSVAEAGVEALVADLRTYAKYYCAMALGNEADSALAEAFADLRELKVDVAYPLLIELYADYAAGSLTGLDLLSLVRTVESYVFRRQICSIPTNSMNKTFAQLAAKLDKDRYVESFTAQMLLLQSYRRFPGDEEFIRELSTKDLYHVRTRSYWLRRLENFDRKEKVNAGEYTIEHILPQNEELRSEWRTDLGEEWRRVQQQWLHTLGNLTLTGYNSEYSDRPFAEKRDMAGGFKVSPLKLNAGLGQVEVWNEAAILGRAATLSQRALKVWKPSVLAAEVLQTHAPTKTPQPIGYTIEDHPKLLASPVASIYNAFRTAVLELDPCVSEEFRKLYVAFKAETNFVDVVPKSDALRLTLNMKFAEVIDPDGRCEDVASLGHWGNGDVEIRLDSVEDLPYIMGVVRQSFEQQMGGAEE